MKDYQHCEYHGKYEAGEWNDWQCPKCAQEVYEYGQHRGHNKPITKGVKNLLKRAGVKW